MAPVFTDIILYHVTGVNQAANAKWLAALTHMSPECGRHLCHETACRVRERQGSVGPDGADDAFLSLVLRKCTIIILYSYNEPQMGGAT